MGIFHPLTELIRFQDLSSSIPHAHELSKKKTPSGKHFVKRKSLYPGNRSNIEYGGLVCVKVHLTLFFSFQSRLFRLAPGFSVRGGDLAGFMGDKFGVSALTSIHAAVVASYLRNSSSRSAQPTVPSANLELYL